MNLEVRLMEGCAGVEQEAKAAAGLVPHFASATKGGEELSASSLYAIQHAETMPIAFVLMFVLVSQDTQAKRARQRFAILSA